jgi:hypothetical protein
MELLFPSGRQALSAILTSAGLGRADRVAIPEWSSACVIGAVSLVATPVSMPDAKSSTQPPSAIVIYDQWGWARRPAAIGALLRKWPNALIVYDTVDTADLDLAKNRLSSSAAQSCSAQVWSLSKVLGLSGGGLARMGSTFLRFSPDESHRRLGDILSADNVPSPIAEDICKSFVHYLPRTLAATIAATDLSAAVSTERALRLANLDAVLGSGMADQWPSWMSEAGRLGPGLCPLLRSVDATKLADIRTRLSAEFNIDLPVYHFDFAGDPLEAAYEPCLALPLHGEVTPHILLQLATAINGYRVDSRT